MKKNIFIFIFIFTFLFTLSTNAEDFLKADSPEMNWRLSSEYENMNHFKGENLGFRYKNITKKNVALGESILISYKYLPLDSKRYEDLPVKEKNKDSYPLSFLKVVYSGYDVEGNIYLTVYSNQNNIDKNKLYTDINNVFATIENPNLALKNWTIFTTILPEYYKTEGNSYIVDPSKEVIFNSNLIPTFKIETNNENSDIKINIVN